MTLQIKSGKSVFKSLDKTVDEMSSRQNYQTIYFKALFSLAKFSTIMPAIATDNILALATLGGTA